MKPTLPMPNPCHIQQPSTRELGWRQVPLFPFLVPRARHCASHLFIGLLLLIACVCQAEDKLPSTAHADQVVVLKKEHMLVLLDHGKTIKKYKVALGADPVGPKTRQGDHKTPEGRYIIDRRNAHSQFYRALHISYPNADDRARAGKLHVSSGGEIMIHGLPNGYSWMGSAHRARDWTDGCIAVTNAEMDEIWRVVPDGTPVEIRP